jgi:hypothetical protein
LVLSLHCSYVVLRVVILKVMEEAKRTGRGCTKGNLAPIYLISES